MDQEMYAVHWKQYQTHDDWHHTHIQVIKTESAYLNVMRYYKKVFLFLKVENKSLYNSSFMY